MSDVMSAPRGELRLPVKQTIRLAYSSFALHGDDLVRASWLWMLLVGVTVAVAYNTSWQTAAIFLQLFAAASIAVAWHRTLILGERQVFLGSDATDRRLWRYILSAFLLFLLTFVPLLAMGGLGRWLILLARSAGAGPLESVLMLPLRLAVLAATIMMTCRLTLVLPARAIGKQEPSFRESWAQTRGNTWRLFWGALTTSIPYFVIVQLFAPSLPGSPNAPDTVTTSADTGDIAKAVAYSLLYMLTLQTNVAFLSHAYQYFFSSRSLPQTADVSDHAPA